MSEQHRNGLLSTILTARSHGLPLMLSPDDFWLTISLSVAQFLRQKENAEKYRNVFVNHNRTKELRVHAKSFGIEVKTSASNKDRWLMLVDAIVQMIDNYTNDEIKEVNDLFKQFLIQQNLLHN